MAALHIHSHLSLAYVMHVNEMCVHFRIITCSTSVRCVLNFSSVESSSWLTILSARAEKVYWSQHNTHNARTQASSTLSSWCFSTISHTWDNNSSKYWASPSKRKRERRTRSYNKQIRMFVLPCSYEYDKAGEMSFSESFSDFHWQIDWHGWNRGYNKVEKSLTLCYVK